jgi:hypothetical protein
MIMSISHASFAPTQAGNNKNYDDSLSTPHEKKFFLWKLCCKIIIIQFMNSERQIHFALHSELISTFTSDSIHKSFNIGAVRDELMAFLFV